MVEKFSDAKGIFWPESVAPFKVQLVGLNLENDEIKNKAFEVYENLEKAGIAVLFDERNDVTTGEKFADADLIGCPYRAVVSVKTGEKVELKKRSSEEVQILTLEELIENLL